MRLEQFSTAALLIPHVVVMIEPPKSPLVRQTVEYTINLSGAAGESSITPSNAATPNTASAPSVVGVYNVSLNDYGAAKFNADGTIVTTSGAKGNWECFDADTRTYIITLNNNRMTMTFQPSRGFVDNNNTLIFQLKPPH
jgi:hypothetical protein